MIRNRSIMDVGLVNSFFVASSVGGPASSPHCGSSVTQPGPKPQNAAGDAVPPRSATSYPAGRSPRTRLMFAGLTWGSAADGALPDEVEGTSAWLQPATTDVTASAIPSPNRRTPVDTTECSMNRLATFCVSRAIN